MVLMFVFCLLPAWRNKRRIARPSKASQTLLCMFEQSSLQSKRKLSMWTDSRLLSHRRSACYRICLAVQNVTGTFCGPSDVRSREIVWSPAAIWYIWTALAESCDCIMGLVIITVNFEHVIKSSYQLL